MNYPNGIRKTAAIRHGHSVPTKQSYGNRGMSLEEDINSTNEYYLETNQAIIHKKPTPIQIVKVHYPKRSAAMITEGYFRSKSTSDYNGIYKGKYIDFEAKETKNKTLFPLANIHEHQFEHMKSIIHHGGICFCIIRFAIYNETYLLEASNLIACWENMLNGGKKSIPYETLKQEGYLIPFKYQARVDYLKIIDQLYF
ncbi:Holliday junction resolvase RecU [Pseudogracilibacillus auburnensis]|uniref:Holliday junction resolvase RecU n=1 Tax=Pseudogracilibacillus auburnensis TaxID=1494959 RepID=A0A2V3W961_9BACI|nr:Holliday junction resolvase RecU [Pseudogracilibacillus auburnensis]MBO1003020.1 Holliday junction resolvase RecU [Pseudogracilibacillus auburnensis]PXW88775.1 recombination protein U [Pseudogracilibacillus auburnensis]